MTLSGRTRVCGIIGDPVQHSMSPVMHNAAFRQAGLDYVYVPFRVRKEELSNAIEGMRALNIRGFNVTIPHKVAVISLLDKLDPLAGKIGAVNTIVNNDGGLTGYNTDAAGFLQSLLDRGIEPEGKKIIVMGAGGAARGVSFILAERGSSLTIANRSLDKAKELAENISKLFRKQAKAVTMDKTSLHAVIADADILVNTTSVGMSPNTNETLLTADQLRPGLVVFDIVYNPLKTRLLKEAEKAGAVTIGGLDMLVWQGALAFELWTGVKPSVQLMKAEAIKLLEGHEN